MVERNSSYNKFKNIDQDLVSLETQILYFLANDRKIYRRVQIPLKGFKKN
jgi:hypothetical protein